MYHFDTNVSKYEADEFAKRIEWVEDGFIVVLIAKDDFSENLTESAIIACEMLGSASIRDVHYRDSWCLIGIKGICILIKAPKRGLFRNRIN
jgi:Interleukin-like EMT inducer